MTWKINKNFYPGFIVQIKPDKFIEIICQVIVQSCWNGEMDRKRTTLSAQELPKAGSQCFWRLQVDGDFAKEQECQGSPPNLEPLLRPPVGECETAQHKAVGQDTIESTPSYQ